MKPIVRIILIILISLVLSLLLPVLPYNIQSGLLGSPVPLVVIYSLIVTFFINAARARSARLRSNISMELSRARRVHHLIDELSSVDPDRAKNIKQAIINYLSEFEKIDFYEHEKTLPLFRQITKPIYSFTKIDTPHDRAVYQDLLSTSREWAAVRQAIDADLKHQLSGPAWLIIIISAILPSMSLIFTRSTSLPTKLTVAAALAMIFLALDLLYEVETISPRERKNFAKRYVENIDILKP